MKILSLASCFLSLLLTACGVSNAATDASYSVVVPGMVCRNCVDHITSELEKIDGVDGVTCELKAKTFTVLVDSAKVKDAEALKAAVKAAGYEATKAEPAAAPAPAPAPAKPKE